MDLKDNSLEQDEAADDKAVVTVCGNKVNLTLKSRKTRANLLCTSVVAGAASAQQFAQYIVPSSSWNATAMAARLSGCFPYPQLSRH